MQAYAYNEYSTPKVYRGPIARVEVIPTRSPRVIADAATEEEADPGADFRARKAGKGNGRVWARIVNPAAVQAGTYSVEFYNLEPRQSAL